MNLRKLLNRPLPLKPGTQYHHAGGGYEQYAVAETIDGLILHIYEANARIYDQNTDEQVDFEISSVRKPYFLSDDKGIIVIALAGQWNRKQEFLLQIIDRRDRPNMSAAIITKLG